MKKYTFHTTRYIAAFAMLFSLSVAAAYPQSQFGDFPFENSFTSTTQPSDITTTGTVSFTTNGIRLTNNTQNNFGGFYVNDRKFSAANGVVIEFEYMMYGGGTSGGDGICMFLFDESIASPTVGAAGAALGYLYNSGTSGKKIGLTGAYLGVAFDAYGNHKQARWETSSSNPPVSSQAGIPFTNSNDYIKQLEGAVDGSYNLTDDVVIRGAKNGTITAYRPITDDYRTLNEGYSGYPVLISQSTNNIRGVVKADDNIGYYNPTTSYTGNLFKISGNTQFTKPSDPGYRKAIIELYPAASEDGGGFYITVSIVHDGITDVIINDYHYKQQFYYKEYIMMYSTFSNALDNTQPSFLLNAQVPAYLRIGFAASTGLQTNYNVLKNVQITLPGAAEAVNDSVQIHYNQTAVIYPYNNDVAYDGIISKNQVGSPDNIDPTAFQFVYNNTTYPVSPAGATYIEVTTTEGVWRYDVATAKVTFKPADGFSGNAQISYNIKGKEDPTPDAGPYEDEAYRSMNADIVVNVLDTAIVPPRKLITNKMVTSRPCQ